MDVFQKLAAQYRSQEKPTTFEYKNPATTLRQRKFQLIHEKIKKILESAIKPEHLQPTEDDDYYWIHLVTFFKMTQPSRPNYHNLTEEKLKENYSESKSWEIDYVEDEMYLPMPQKVKEWIVLMLNNHRLFEALEKIGHNLKAILKDEDYMTSDTYKKEMRSVEFLMDYQFVVTCDLVGNYEEYCEARKQKEMMEGMEELKRIRNEAERNKEQEIADMETLKNIFKALYEFIMREVALLQEREREQREKEQREKEQKERERQRLIMDKSKGKSSNDSLPEYIQRPRTTYLQSTPNLHALQTPTMHTNEPHLKKSQILYRQEFQRMQEEFHFNVEPEESEDKSECFECKAKLHLGLYVIGNNQNLCHYTGQYYCNECISPQRTAIPWKALRNFDLRGYIVSKNAFNEIRAYFDKPIIEIPLNSLVIQKSRALFEFLIVKRQIHLMYDSICNVELIEGVLKAKLNYCLKQNLFSLRNLSNIYNAQELSVLEEIYAALSKHFNRCKDCLKKGFICKICNKPDRIFTFELRETKGCGKCKKLYHVHCLRYKPCICSNK